MENKINSFTVYRNNFSLIKVLPNRRDKEKISLAMLEFMFLDIEPNFDINSDIYDMWENMIMILKKQKRNALNGAHGGAPIGNNNAEKQPKKQPKIQPKEQSKKQANNIYIFNLLINNFYISKFIDISKLDDIEKNILFTLLDFKVEGDLKAREVQLLLKDYLESKGMKVTLEEFVESNGISNHTGRIDLIAEFKNKVIAIEYDNVSPRYKSIYKVSNYKADLKFVLLRNGIDIREENNIFILGTNKQDFLQDNRYLLKMKLEEWLEYKTERKEDYTEIGLKSLLTQIKNNTEKYGETAIIELINECMASNYKGIIFDKLKPKGKNEKKPEWFDKKLEKQEASQEKQEEMKEMLKEFQ